MVTTLLGLLMVFQSDARTPDASAYQAVFAEGVAAQHRGDLQTAVKKYQEVERLNPLFAPAIFNMGLVLDQTADYSGALASFRKVLEISKGYPNARLFLGIESVRLDKAEDAVVPLYLATRENPSDKQPWFWLAKAHLLLHHHQEAIEAARKCEEIAPSDASVQFLIASIYMAEQEWERSEPILTKLSQEFPTVPEIQGSLGVVYLNEARTELALDKFRSLLRAHPDNLQAKRMMGQILTKQGNYEEAIPYLSDALKDAPDSMDLQLAMTEACWHQHLLEEAVSHAKTAVTLDPFNPRPHYFLWRIYSEMKKSAESESELNAMKKCSSARAD